MKTIIYLGLALLVPLNYAKARLHLDLQMSAGEYRQHLSETVSLGKALRSKSKVSLDDLSIQLGLKLGDRLSKWIELINNYRLSGNPIRLSSPSFRRSIPIESPSIYSAPIIQASIDEALSQIPESMKIALTTDSALSPILDIDDETFIRHARVIDKIYQNSARYKLLNPYRSKYISAARRDVRGLHYLNTNKITAEILKDVSGFDPVKQKEIKEALTIICKNSAGPTIACEDLVEKAFVENRLSSVYDEYIDEAKSNWDSFFKISRFSRKRSIKWIDNVMTVPFIKPQEEKLVSYLKDNIEDEFRFKGWMLKLDLILEGKAPRLKFESGVVPHVLGLGGNEIVMDANQSLEEFDAKWTIRHEFGHILGLPDCYHEFFDVELQAFVNYQIDTTDLMCSRAGNMNQRIFDELQEAYYFDL